MKMLSPSHKIYAGQSRVVPAERGVFATTAIQKGELIEACPVIPISEHDTESIAEESLVTYMYYFGKKSAIALGFGSLYNHADNPNAEYREKGDEQVIEFWAIKDIKKDEEITVSYQQGCKDKRPLWFESK